MAASPRPASNDWLWRSIKLHAQEKLPAISVSCSSIGPRRINQGAAGAARIAVITPVTPQPHLPGQDQHSGDPAARLGPLDNYRSEVHSPNYVRSS